LLHKDSTSVTFILIQFWRLAARRSTAGINVTAGASFFLTLAAIGPVVAIVIRRTRAGTSAGTSATSTTIEVTAGAVVVTVTARTASLRFATLAPLSASKASVSTSSVALHDFIALKVSVGAAVTAVVAATASVTGTVTALAGVCAGVVITAFGSGWGLGGSGRSRLQKSLYIKSRHFGT
jgi:hypothetical protein